MSASQRIYLTDANTRRRFRRRCEKLDIPRPFAEQMLRYNAQTISPLVSKERGKNRTYIVHNANDTVDFYKIHECKSSLSPRRRAFLETLANTEFSQHPMLASLVPGLAHDRRMEGTLEIPDCALSRQKYVPEPGSADVPIDHWLEAYARVTAYASDNVRDLAPPLRMPPFDTVASFLYNYGISVEHLRNEYNMGVGILEGREVVLSDTHLGNMRGKYLVDLERLRKANIVAPLPLTVIEYGLQMDLSIAKRYAVHLKSHTGRSFDPYLLAEDARATLIPIALRELYGFTIPHWERMVKIFKYLHL